MAYIAVGFPPPEIFMERLMGHFPVGYDFSHSDYSKVSRVGDNLDIETMQDRLYKAIEAAGVMTKTTLAVIVERYQVRKYRPKPAMNGSAGCDVPEIAACPRAVATEENTAGDVSAPPTILPDEYFFNPCGLSEDRLQAVVEPYNWDPFLPLERAAETGHVWRAGQPCIDTMDNLAGYAERSFVHQHRTCVFQLIIAGSRARFVRWDRAGLIASDSFDYAEHPHILSEFLWRYDNMSEVQRGLDTSVSNPLPAEEELFTAAVKEFLINMDDDEHEQLILPHAKDTLKDWYRIRKVQVFDAAGFSHDVLVQCPFYQARSVCGRATAIYVAYDLKEKRLRCLKDSWRLNDRLILPEFDAYTALKNIQYVPQGVIAGDVVVDGAIQQTITHEWTTLDNSWKYTTGPVKRYIHARVLQEILYPIQAAKNSRQWVIVVYHCIMALLAAHAAGIRHRDISLGNVMMDADRNGQLTDWDYAGRVGAKNDDLRVGTWKFVSSALLSNRKKRQDLLDDLEACVWTLLYGAFYFFANKNEVYPGVFIKGEKIHSPIGTDKRLEGRAKEIFLSNFHDRLEWDSHALTTLISALCKHFGAYYDAIRDYRQYAKYAPRCVIFRVAKEETGAKLKAMKEKMTKQSFWTEIFDAALQREDWLEDDAVPDMFPHKAAAQKTSMTYFERTITSYGSTDDETDASETADF